jgi:hypothetical protein
VKHPHNSAVGANLGCNWNKKGDNAKEARSIRADVAAEGVRYSFMIAPLNSFEDDI